MKYGKVLFLIAPLFARALFAQATGTIYGTTYDSSGAILPATNITITSTGTNQTRAVVAGETGEFLAPLLPVGTYSVKVEKAGFAPFVQNGVILEANTSVQVRATMQVQAASQNVVVSANQTLVQANATNLVQVIDERRIVDLPLNGRNVLQLVALDAGIDDRNAIGGTEQVNTLAQGAYASPFCGQLFLRPRCPEAQPVRRDNRRSRSYSVGVQRQRPHVFLLFLPGHTPIGGDSRLARHCAEQRDEAG